LRALQRRMLSGFLADTPLPEVCEVESDTVATMFAGPVEAIGFTDLTDTLEREGLLDEINPPSFAPWSSRGRIFGLPHDVHPVMLAYRADITEAAGIDLTQVETWEDFARVMRPLQVDEDGDGHPDRWAINMWDTDQSVPRMLLLQAGVEFFDEQGRPTLNTPRAAMVLSRVVTWTGGPERIGVNAPIFGEGRQMFISGQVLSNLSPDWLAGIFLNEVAGLKGKLKLIPMPAWEPGGRRTSVWGGTMLGIPKRSDFDEAWQFAKRLYLDPALAEELYQKSLIISPIRKNWDLPLYDEPIEYFSHQPVGRMYIDLAPHVPRRSSNPFKIQAHQEITYALSRLKRYAESTNTWDLPTLIPQAREELRIAQEYVADRMKMNPFLQPADISSAEPLAQAPSLIYGKGGAP
jgi:arabinosaccharide transport system substrate-binding protein